MYNKGNEWTAAYVDPVWRFQVGTASLKGSDTAASFGSGLSDSANWQG